jgi:hypothetical protein
MTDEQINLAIAEACGWEPRRKAWKIATSENGYAIGYYDSKKTAERELKELWRNTCDWKRLLDVFPVLEDAPDFCNDLNEMHKAEKIHRMDGDWHEYLHQLERDATADIAYATARQRAEAFLRTLGKWEEGE